VHRVAALADSDAGTTVTPTAMTAGTTTNTVPAAGRFAVDVRAWSQAELERVDAALKALAPVLPDALVVVHGGINRPPLEESSSRHLFARASALASRMGLPPVTGAAVGGASDGNFTAGVGVATLDGLGAVGGGAHAADEHVLVDRLLDRTALLGALLTDVLDGVPDDD
jgi:glutamate carboxypeptidase